MVNVDAVVVGSAFLLFGLFFLYIGWVSFRTSWIMRRLQTSPVAAVKGGLVEVKGHVAASGEPLRAPFSGEPCVFYAAKVEEWVRGARRFRWSTVEDVRSEQPFQLHDATGAVRVSSDADLLFLEDSFQEVNSDLDPERIAQIEAMGITDKHWSGLNRRFRFTERILRSGQEAYVVGTAGAGGDDVVIGPHKGQPSLIADKPEGAVGKQNVKAMLFGGLFGSTLVAIGVWALRSGLLAP